MRILPTPEEKHEIAALTREAVSLLRQRPLRCVRNVALWMLGALPKEARRED